MRKNNRFNFNAWMDTEWPLILITIFAFICVFFSMFFPFWL